MTLLEGWAWRLGNWVCWLFLAYLLLFTRVVGAALMTACGVAGAGIMPLGEPDLLRDHLGACPFRGRTSLSMVWQLRAV